MTERQRRTGKNSIEADINGVVIQGFAPYKISEINVTANTPYDIDVKDTLALKLVADNDFTIRLYNQGTYSEATSEFNLVINHRSVNRTITINSPVDQTIKLWEQ